MMREMKDRVDYGALRWFGHMHGEGEWEVIGEEGSERRVELTYIKLEEDRSMGEWIDGVEEALVD